MFPTEHRKIDSSCMYNYSLPSAKAVTLLVGLWVSISQSPLNLLLFLVTGGSDLSSPVTKNSNKSELMLQKMFISKWSLDLGRE